MLGMRTPRKRGGEQNPREALIIRLYITTIDHNFASLLICFGSPAKYVDISPDPPSSHPCDKFVFRSGLFGATRSIVSSPPVGLPCHRSKESILKCSTTSPMGRKDLVPRRRKRVQSAFLEPYGPMY